MAIIPQYGSSIRNFNHSSGTASRACNYTGAGGIGGTAGGGGPVPELATWAMTMLGFGTMGYAMRRKVKTGARISFG